MVSLKSQRSLSFLMTRAVKVGRDLKKIEKHSSTFLEW